MKDKFKKELELEKVITENKYLQETIAESKQKILSLESKIENIFTQALHKEFVENANEEKSKKLRSRDILGD